MRSLYRALVTTTLLLSLNAGHANNASCATNYIPSCDKITCCGDMGGISYCDSSAGRYVCSNGYISSCYCTRHAIMDLQKLEGCCLWQGGVLDIDPKGLVICNNGGVSEVCSLEVPPQAVSSW